MKSKKIFIEPELSILGSVEEITQKRRRRRRHGWGGRGRGKESGFPDGRSHNSGKHNDGGGMMS